jgi:hypothetical protein
MKRGQVDEACRERERGEDCIQNISQKPRRRESLGELNSILKDNIKVDVK